MAKKVTLKKFKAGTTRTVPKAKKMTFGKLPKTKKQKLTKSPKKKNYSSGIKGKFGKALA